MANNIPFQPMGKTVQITASNTAVNNVTFTADSPSNQYMLANHDTKPVYVWISPASNPKNVATPTGNGANAQYAIVVPSGLVMVITGPQSSNTTAVQASAISENDGPEIYITPGEGF